MTPKVILMSDLHITEPGTHIVGLDPACRFRRCLDHATLHHAEACHLFLMGDLTHHGRDAEYVILREILSAQPFPATLMLGNHDRRGPFAQVFPEHSEAFQHGHQDFGATRILYLDTLDEYAPNKHSGLMCAERLSWLQAQLEVSQEPMIVLAHHHMLASGFDGMDEIKLSNGLAVAEMIAGSNRCQMVINGHIHRTIFSSFKGVSHAMIKSPCHQMPMILGAGASSLSVAEPGGYGLLLLDAQSPVLHHVDVDLPSGPVEFDAVS